MATMLILTDADNTLWDTNSVYRDAQLEYFDEITRIVGTKAQIPDKLAYLRNIDQGIASKHKDHFRYPPILLAEELYRSLNNDFGGERSNAVALSKDVAALLTRAANTFGSRVATTVPALREGVAKGLSELQKLGARVVVVTEGPAERCDNLLRTHAIRDAVADVVHVARKNVVAFKQISDQSFTGPKLAIGDQVEKDLYPAKEAGFKTVFFPSDLKFKWSGTVNESFVDYRIQSYLDVVSIAQELGAVASPVGSPSP